MRKKFWQAKKDAKPVVYMAMGQKAQERVEKNCQAKGWGEERCCWRVNCLKDECVTLIVSVDNRKTIWKEHMDRLLTAKSLSVRGASHHPAFMVSCLTISQTRLSCPPCAMMGFRLW